MEAIRKGGWSYSRRAFELKELQFVQGHGVVMVWKHVEQGLFIHEIGDEM